jgi:cell division protein FtsW
MDRRPVGNYVKASLERARNQARRFDFAAFWQVIKESLKVTNDKFVAQRKHRPDRLIFILIMVLLLISLVTLWSIAPARAQILGGGADAEFKFVAKLILVLLFGTVVFFICSRINLNVWRRLSTWLLVGAFAACLILALLGLLGSSVANCANGACRWYNFGFFDFQPAELMKLAMLLFTAGFLAQKTKLHELGSIKRTILPLICLLLFALFVVVFLERDLGTGVALIGIILTQLIIAKASWRIITALIVILVGFGVLAVIVAPHRMERIASFGADCSVIDAESDTWHICQSLTALGSGGVFGRGLGHSISSFGWLPEAINDSIFAIMGETFGLIGLVTILFIFYTLLYRILKIADYIDNTFLRILTAGVFGWILSHILVNIGSMTGLIPLTGITLPFLSSGGTSLLFIMAASGIVFNISRYTAHHAINEQEGDISDHEDSGSWRRVRRTRYTSGSGSESYPTKSSER